MARNTSVRIESIRVSAELWLASAVSTVITFCNDADCFMTQMIPSPAIATAAMTPRPPDSRMRYRIGMRLSMGRSFQGITRTDELRAAVECAHEHCAAPVNEALGLAGSTICS